MANGADQGAGNESPPLRRAGARARLRGLPINRMIPNALTLLALAAGLSALRFALQERWEHAALAVLAAAVLDALDGRIARILKGATRFGAELDSLSDFLCFGVAPAFVLYQWTLHNAGRFGWLLVLLWSICAALRLARFNTDVDLADGSVPPPWERNYFVGLPSPAGAGLVLLPLALWLEIDAPLLRSPTLVTIVMLVGACLLVSRVRTFSFKKVRLKQGWAAPVMIGFGLYLACLLSNLWLTLATTQLAYLASIPFADRQYRQARRQQPATFSVNG